MEDLFVGALAGLAGANIFKGGASDWRWWVFLIGSAIAWGSMQ